MTHADLSDAAGAIRAHLWKPTMPKFHGESRPWSMGRELSIFKLLVKAGFSPDDLVGAITVARTLRTDWTGPLSLRIFYWKTKDGFCATPFLEACVGYHHKNMSVDRRDRARLPNSVKSTLLGMLNG